MKKLILFFLLIAIVASYPFFRQSDDAEPLTGLPWQIEVLPDGSTRVFGLHIGVSRLSDALQQLGDDMELAIVAAAGETGNLEMYYGHYRTGLLSGKLVLQTSTAPSVITGWRENAVKSEYMATGNAKKYSLAESDVSPALNQIITGVTFIPAVNLDEDVIIARFGEPAERFTTNEVSHFVYPDKGLDIALHAKSKEVLQYVSPHAFEQLMQPFTRQ